MKYNLTTIVLTKVIVEIWVKKQGMNQEHSDHQKISKEKLFIKSSN